MVALAAKWVLGWFIGEKKTPWAYVLVAVVTALGLFLISPQLSKVGAWLGFETKASLKKDLETEKANNVVLKDANKSNSETIGVLEGTNENIQKSFENVEEAKKISTLKADKVNVKRIDKIEHIKVDTTLTELEKVEQVSQAQIDSIWQTYCQFNEDPQCSTVPPLDITP